MGVAKLKTAFIKRERDGWTLLHLFAGGDECEGLVAFFLQAGIPVDIADNVGWTPLLEAAQEGQIRNSELLLSKGAAPDRACAVGTTPLKAAIMASNNDMTLWLLEQRGTWSNHWDTGLFELLLKRTPGVAFSFLDKFAMERGHARGGKTAVKYCDLRSIYGEPNIPVHRTALAIAVEHHDTHIVISHRVFKHIMMAKWETFGRKMFVQEVTAFCGLLSSYYITTIWADPDWIHFQSAFDYWVAVSRAVAWICCLYLLVVVEYRNFRGCVGWKYFKSFWNWIELAAYLAILATIPLEFIGASTIESRNSLLAFITVALWINVLQYLQISEKTGLLLAMMSRMVRDVVQFFIIYGVFVLGFSGGFYLLFRGETGYDNFVNSFFTVFLMLFGQVTWDPFSGSSGWKWHMSHLLLFLYLICVVIMLLNILIAMMAATYAMISDSAEDRTWLGYAKLILRMERSLSTEARKQQFDRLVKHGNAHVASCSVEGSGEFGRRAVSTNSVIMNRETSHHKIDHIRIDSTSDRMKKVSDASITEVEKCDSPTILNHEPLSIASLTYSALRKSAFNLDKQINLLHAKPLGLLEDGVRYENAREKHRGQPVCAQSDSDAATQVLHLVKDMPLQILQLTDKIQELEMKLSQVLTRDSSRLVQPLNVK